MCHAFISTKDVATSIKQEAIIGLLSLLSRDNIDLHNCIEQRKPWLLFNFNAEFISVFETNYVEEAFDSFHLHEEYRELN